MNLCLADASTELVNAGGIEESVKLLKNASKKPHLVFNLISLFTAICQDGEALTSLPYAFFLVF